MAGVALALAAAAFAAPCQGKAQADPPAARQLVPATSNAAPPFTLPDLAGAPRSLTEHRGRVVLVHFFATWCEPCRAELASLSELARRREGRLTVVAVNVAEVPVRVRRFLEASPVTFPVVLDTERKVTRAWGVDILPTTVALDPALRPRLLVEGDLDWLQDHVLSALDAIGVAPSAEPPSTPRTSSGRRNP